MYQAYITKLKDVRPHPNADKLQLATVFSNTIVVSLTAKTGDLGIYFPTDGQLSAEFCSANKLLRSQGGYLEDDKRAVKAIRLRGEKSDGLFMSLAALEPFGDISALKPGDPITAFGGTLICQKYVPNTKARRAPGSGDIVRKPKTKIAPLFKEHKDTEQLAYNLGQFKPGDILEVTLKMHGTSQRTAHLPIFKGYRRSLLDRLFRRAGTPVYDYGIVTGTRRVVLEEFNEARQFRKPAHDFFANKLHKGETVYYELVGYENEQTTIMPICSNAKNALGKEFPAKYGEKTIFHYGCQPGENHIYVYRMTMTNEDGVTVEYSPQQMRQRCEEMAVDYVPVFETVIIPRFETQEEVEDFVLKLAEKYYEGDDPVGKTHIREGVVVRIVSNPSFRAYKMKGFAFKVLEGLVKDSAETPDTEEAEDLAAE